MKLGQTRYLRTMFASAGLFGSTCIGITCTSIAQTPAPQPLPLEESGIRNIERALNPSQDPNGAAFITHEPMLRSMMQAEPQSNLGLRVRMMLVRGLFNQGNVREALELIDEALMLPSVTSNASQRVIWADTGARLSLLQLDSTERDSLERVSVSSPAAQAGHDAQHGEAADSVTPEILTTKLGQYVRSLHGAIAPNEPGGPLQAQVQRSSYVSTVSGCIRHLIKRQQFDEAWTIAQEAATIIEDSLVPAGSLPQDDATQFRRWRAAAALGVGNVQQAMELTRAAAGNDAASISTMVLNVLARAGKSVSTGAVRAEFAVLHLEQAALPWNESDFSILESDYALARTPGLATRYVEQFNRALAPEHAALLDEMDASPTRAQLFVNSPASVRAKPARFTLLQGKLYVTGVVSQQQATALHAEIQELYPDAEALIRGQRQ